MTVGFGERGKKLFTPQQKVQLPPRLSNLRLKGKN
jgi:hypothetical protein